MQSGYQSGQGRPWTLSIRRGWLDSDAAASRPREPGRSPAMTEPVTPVIRSVISSPDTQTAIWFLGALSQVRISGEQTGGGLAPPPHPPPRGHPPPGPLFHPGDE